MRIVGACDMRGFHEHVCRQRLFQTALNIWFNQGKVLLLDLRTGARAVQHVAMDAAARSSEEDEESATEPPGVSAEFVLSSPVPATPLVDRPDEKTADYVGDTCQDSLSEPSPTTITSSKLRNLSNKVTRTRSHADFLATCFKERLVPKGFQLNWRSQYEDDDLTVEIIGKASCDLVRSGYQLSNRKLVSLRAELDQGWSYLKSTLNAEELSRLSIQLSRDRQRIGSRLQRTKLGKLSALREGQRRGKDSGERAGLGVPADQSAACLDRASPPVNGVQSSPLATPTQAVSPPGTDEVGRGENGWTDTMPVTVPLMTTATSPVRGQPVEGSFVGTGGDCGKPRGSKSVAAGSSTARGRTGGCRRNVDNDAGKKDAGTGSVGRGVVKVTNLSSKVLSPSQLSLLSKGLGFVPVKKQSMTHLLSELKEWERLNRLKEFWSDCPQDKSLDGVLNKSQLYRSGCKV